MCGIVGLHLREPALYPRLGELLTAMLGALADRGPDSAGMAIYGDPTWSPEGHSTVTLLDSAVPADRARGRADDRTRRAGHRNRRVADNGVTRSRPLRTPH